MPDEFSLCEARVGRRYLMHHPDDAVAPPHLPTEKTSLRAMAWDSHQSVHRPGPYGTYDQGCPDDLPKDSVLSLP